MLFENYNPLNKKMFQIMDENSNIINEDYMPNLTKEELLVMYENMIQGREAERIKFTSLRKTIARNMTKSMYTVPHALCMDEVDVTELVNYR